ncbi:MAG: M20/M25/M40 family metallo-hydrolase [Pseudomonadota bacterium]
MRELARTIAAGAAAFGVAAAQPSQGVRNAIGEGDAGLLAADVLTSRQAARVDDLIDRGLESDLAYEILESLTTEIGPRLAGSEEEARARDWGVATFKRLGFKNVRVEPFDIPYWRRVRERAEIVSPFPQALAVTALGNSVATPDGGLEAEVVRFASLADLKNAPTTGLEGKIVFVDEKMTRTMDGSGYGPAVAKRSGAANEAGKRGAAAAIIRSVGTDSHRMPHTGGMRYQKDVARIPTAALSNPDADQLARALERAKEPVVLRLDIDVATRASSTSGNVIGEIPGETDEIVVVGGHLDSWDLGTGAVDDGAGVAITTAAAKLVMRAGGKPRRTIRVVMWGSEEVGLYGARAYAKAHADELGRHAMASESDFGAGNVWSLQSRVGEEDLPAFDEMARRIARLKINRGDNAAYGGPDVSPLRAAGVPVFSLRQNGLDYFDLHHTPDDTLDKVDREDLKQNVAAWAAMIYMTANTPVDFRPEPKGDEAISQ